jgi:hypothetical protein
VASPRRWTGTAAALVVLTLAAPARGDVGDGGAPADAGAGAAAQAVDAAGAGVGDVDAEPAEAPAAAAGTELATPSEISSAQLPAKTPLIGEPTPAEAEPPRPITRRLWFWMAVTGVAVGSVLLGMTLSNPNTTRPECPAGYVCPP